MHAKTNIGDLSKPLFITNILIECRAAIFVEPSPQQSKKIYMYLT